MTDYVGIALVITSLTGAVGGVTGAIVALVGLKRGAARDLKLVSIEKHVNDLSDKREAMGVRVGTAEGHASGMIEGADKERANPTLGP